MIAPMLRDSPNAPCPNQARGPQIVPSPMTLKCDKTIQRPLQPRGVLSFSTVVGCRRLSFLRVLHSNLHCDLAVVAATVPGPDDGAAPPAARLLAAGALGDVLYVDVRGLSGAKLDRERPLHWRNSIELSGHNQPPGGAAIGAPTCD